MKPKKDNCSLMPASRFFGDDALIAFTSDASIDFTPADFDAPLTQSQRVYLKARTGTEVPQVFWRRQVHGDGVVVAQGNAADCRAYPDADAFVTNKPGLPIAIRTADCVPVFVFDPLKRVIALAHAGWKGTCKQIAAKTVKTMQDKFGCQCYDLRITLGPSIRPCCYEVSEEFLDYFPRDTQKRDGRFYADMIAANRRQLIDAGIRPVNIFDSGVCTACDQNYFSFRRDGEKAGRMISLMVLL